MPRPQARGFKTCVIGLAREHVERAREVLGRHACVVDGSPLFDGDRLRWEIDLARIPEGDGPSIELVLIREIHAAVRP